MAFTYFNPGNSLRDAVRFLIGDTDSSEVFLQDEEIDWLISIWDTNNDYSAYFVGYRAADAIASKLAREVDVTSDGQTVGINVLMEKYRSLAMSLLEQYRELLASGATVYVGGVDAGEQPDPTVLAPAFGTQMHDNHEAGRQDYGDRGNQMSSWESGQWGEFNP